jgi:hypothetical protein
MYMKKLSALMLVFGMVSAGWADTVSITGSTTIYVGQTKTYTVSYSGGSSIMSYDVDLHANDMTKGTLCCVNVINPPPDCNPIVSALPPDEGGGYEVSGTACGIDPIGNPWFTFGLTGVATGQVTIYLENIAIFDDMWNELFPTMGSIVVNVAVDPNNCLYVGRVFNNGLTVTQSMVSRWNYLGKPACWCCEAQKFGNGIYTGASLARVDTSDMACLRQCWMRNYNQSGYSYCCDFDLSGRCDTVDMSIIKNHWMHMEGTCGL